MTYYNWHQIHDRWMNDVMKEQLGETEGLGRRDFPNIYTTARLLQVWKIHPLPTRAFGVRYGVHIHIKVQESIDPLAEARISSWNYSQKYRRWIGMP